MRKKLITAIIALTLALSCLVGVTVAWLSVKTENVVNTFSPSNIGLTLTETTGNTYKMIPGETLAKNPTVTVTNDIACYVFVKVEKINNVDNFLDYSIDTSVWTKLESGVYYKIVEANAANKTFNVLTDNEVTVKDTVTKDDMANLYNTDGTVKANTELPNLTFTAYAIQQAGFETAEAAWTEAQKLG